MSSLFRPEVLEARRDAWLGKVQDVQPIPIRIIAILSLVFAIAIAIYVYFGGYTRRVHTIGSMMPPTGLVTVGARANGVIITRNAIEGKHVKKGDVLFVVNLDDQSRVGPTQSRINETLIQQKKILQDQLTIRERDAPLEKQNLQNQITTLTKQYTKITNQIQQDNEILPLIKKSLDMVERAKKQSLATNVEYQNQLYSYAQLLSSHAQFLQSQTTVEGQIIDNISKLKRYENTLEHDLNEIRKQIIEVDQHIVEGEGKEKNLIVAPSDGVLTAVRGYVGQQVSTGVPLVTLLPEGYQLEAELYVPSSAIGFIRIGEPVVLRYSAFPYQKFGLYDGKVSEVTSTPVTSSVSGKEAGGGQSSSAPASSGGKQSEENSMYRIRVKPNLPYVMVYNPQKKLKEPHYLEAGMAVEADIAIDHRRLYQWMFQPVIEIKNTVRNVLGSPRQ